MDTTIIGAIQDRNVLSFNYKGTVREVEPHTYGVNTAGHETLSCFQVAGGSKTGAPTDWKTFLISEMSGLSITSRGFSGPRPDFVRNAKTFSRIYAQL